MKTRKIYAIVLVMAFARTQCTEYIDVGMKAVNMVTKLAGTLPNLTSEAKAAFESLKAKGPIVKQKADALKSAKNQAEQLQVLPEYLSALADFFNGVALFLARLDDNLIIPVFEFAAVVPQLQNLIDLQRDTDGKPVKISVKDASGATIEVPNTVGAKIGGILKAINSYNAPFKKVSAQLPALIKPTEAAAASAPAVSFEL